MIGDVGLGSDNKYFLLCTHNDNPKSRHIIFNRFIVALSMMTNQKANINLSFVMCDIYIH